MPEANKNQNKNASDELKELVIARLDVLPPNRKISIGSDGEFTKGELIERVKIGDEVGQTVIELELEFLRALKDGTLLEEALASSS
jgi:hypothetical protein